MTQTNQNLPDAIVRFEADGPGGAQFIRYQDTLLTWKEFVETICWELSYPWDKAQIFATEYINCLRTEIL